MYYYSVDICNDILIHTWTMLHVFEGYYRKLFLSTGKSITLSNISNSYPCHHRVLQRADGTFIRMYLVQLDNR